MSRLEDLIRYESPGSSVAFRGAIYGPQDDAELVRDCVALANADVRTRRRFIFLGVDDSGSDARRFPGVRRKDLIRLKQDLSARLAQLIEPVLEPSVHGIEIDGTLIGILCFEDCRAAPYLTKRNLGANLPAGVGFIRRGARIMPLQRADMRRMFERSAERELPAALVRVGFAGKELESRVTLPVLGIKKLPSQVAADRLRTVLEANAQAREAFGETQTRIARLVHAKVFGVDAPFQKQGDATLMQVMASVDKDHGAADDHYRYEVRAHKLDLLVSNDRETVLNNVRLVLMLGKSPGIGVARRIYAEHDDLVPRDGYPEVVETGSKIRISADIGTLHPQRRCHAFSKRRDSGPARKPPARP